MKSNPTVREVLDTIWKCEDIIFRIEMIQSVSDNLDVKMTGKQANTVLELLKEYKSLLETKMNETEVTI